MNDAGNGFADFVRGKSIVEAMRDFATDDPRPRMVMKMSLPDGYPPADALELCRRGVVELRNFLA